MRKTIIVALIIVAVAAITAASSVSMWPRPSTAKQAGWHIGGGALLLPISGVPYGERDGLWMVGMAIVSPPLQRRCCT
jgi:hypothetical protein